jgi:hypothetical protein
MTKQQAEREFATLDLAKLEAVHGGMGLFGGAGLFGGGGLFGRWRQQSASQSSCAGGSCASGSCG